MWYESELGPVVLQASGSIKWPKQCPRFDIDSSTNGGPDMTDIWKLLSRCTWDIQTLVHQDMAKARLGEQSSAEQKVCIRTISRNQAIVLG